MRIFALISVSLILTTYDTNSFPVDLDPETTEYMRRFGYLPPQSESFASLLSPNQMRLAIENFQRFAGLAVTGEMNSKTREMMTKPRCGNPDMPAKTTAKRKKRFALQGNRWPRNSLTYKITENGYTRQLSRSDVNREIREAFQWWSDVTPLNFNVVNSNSRADIDIFFAEGAHRDGNPFDGNGGTLAHAFFPQNGDAHFDDAETWQLNSNRGGVNLKLVAAHEFGHSLGLDHSDVNQALMAPFYNPRITELHRDDIQAIQRLYGPSTDKPDALPTSRTTTTRRTISTTTRSTTTRSPSRGACNGRFEAIVQIKNGSTYAFVGDMLWRLNSRGVDKGFPKPIKDVWRGIEGPVDAALSFGDIVDIFQGTEVYRFENGKPTTGFPRLISKFYRGIPNDVSAAFRWSGNGKIYFMKGDQYWRYNRYTELVDSGYPRDISIWGGLPSNIDAAFQWYGRTYFFSDTMYYRFNDTSIRVAELQERPYPRRTDEWWLGCVDPTVGQAGLNLNKDPGGTGATISSSVSLLFVSFVGIWLSLILNN